MSCIIYLRSYPANIKLKNKLLHVFPKVEGPAPYQGTSLERSPVRGSAGANLPFFFPLSACHSPFGVVGSAESSSSCTGQESSQRKGTGLISSEKQEATQLATTPSKKTTRSQTTEDYFEEVKKFQINHGRWPLGDGQVCQFFQEHKSFADGLTVQLTASIPNPSWQKGASPQNTNI